MDEAGGPTVDVAEERGETLLELLVTMVLMGIAVVGVLAGLLAVARQANYSSETTSLGNTGQSYAEALKQPVLDTAYIECATPHGPGSARPYPLLEALDPDLVPGQYVARITAIDYLQNPPDGTPADEADWGPGCTVGSDKGLQRITVTVTSESSVSERTGTVTLIKRNQTCSATYQNRFQGPC